MIKSYNMKVQHVTTYYNILQHVYLPVVGVITGAAFEPSSLLGT